MSSAPIDPHAELRSQRADIIGSINEVEAAMAGGQGVPLALLMRLIGIVREHLLLATFVYDSAPPAHVADTAPPPADPTLVPCTPCGATGVVRDPDHGAMLCTSCYGQGCL